MRFWAAALCFLLAAGGCPPGGGSGWGEKGARSFRLKDPELVEASGIACSLRRPGYFWIHNDSGDLPRLFAVDEKGRTAGTVLLEGVLALDWEDCALEPPREKGGVPMLWAGDIGNNLGLPLLKVLYRFPEPDPGKLGKRKGKVLKIPKKEFSVFRCRFPGGRRDCECLMVHPLTGIPYLVPAVNGPEVGLFRWPGKLEAGRKVRILEETALLRVPLSTPAGRRIRGGDFGPGGKWFVLRSLTHFLIYSFPPGRAGGEKNSPPVLRPLLVLKAPKEIQGEGVAVEPGGKALWLCGEGKGSKVIRVPLPPIPN